MVAGIVGLISDTHGLLRQEAADALRGSSLIVHAGDIGGPEILQRLERIAPIVAVRGNIDREPWCTLLLPQVTVETILGPLCVLHDGAQLKLNPSAAGFKFVVSGHSHKARHEERDGVVYINPGSAGPRRFKLPVTVARLLIEQSGYSLAIVELVQQTR